MVVPEGMPERWERRRGGSGGVGLSSVGDGE
jgi:hypothetical protein